MILILLGFLLLAVSRVFIGLHFGEGIHIFSFFGGAALFGLGLYIQDRRRKLQ